MANSTPDRPEGALTPTRILPNGDRLDVLAQIYTWRLTLTLASNAYWQETYDNCWCYHDLASAIRAQTRWDGTGDPPEGWHRHPPSGRRRPDGDATQEYVNL